MIKIKDPKIKAIVDRAFRTLCQSAVAGIGTATAMNEVNWKYVLSSSAIAAILSILTSVITSLPEVDQMNNAPIDKPEDGSCG